MPDRPWLDQYDPGVPHNIDFPEQTLIDLLAQAALHSPKSTCIIHQKRKISYANLEKQTDQLAAGLVTLGIRKGDRVGLLVHNTPEFVTGFMGILTSQ